MTYTFAERELVRRIWVDYMRRLLPSTIWLLVIGAGVVWSAAGVVALAPFLGLILLLMVISTPFKAWYRFSELIRRDPDCKGPITIDFDESGLKVTRPKWRSEMDWSFFKSFSEDKKFIFLARWDMAPSPGVLVPKRAFASTEEMDSFRKFANEGMARAQ